MTFTHTEPKAEKNPQPWIRNQLWDQVPVAIGVIGPDFKMVEANRAFRESYGKGKADSE